MKRLICIILCGLLYACQPGVKEENLPDANELACPEARPQICTMIYDPVCARHKDGSQTTEASNCTACAKPEVMTYRMGACEAEM